jgi:two-component system sensor histidine kinase KdpD
MKRGGGTTVGKTLWWVPFKESSPDIQALLRKLELIPPLQTPEGQAVDLDAILHRAPQVCVIDPLAAQNPPGSRHAYRWQDVQELLRNGISVLSSVNLLYVEEYREKVQAITGKTLRTPSQSLSCSPPTTS